MVTRREGINTSIAIRVLLVDVCIVELSKHRVLVTSRWPPVEAVASGVD